VALGFVRRLLHHRPGVGC